MHLWVDKLSRAYCKPTASLDKLSRASGEENRTQIVHNLKIADTCLLQASTLRGGGRECTCGLKSCHAPTNCKYGPTANPIHIRNFESAETCLLQAKRGEGGMHFWVDKLSPAYKMQIRTYCKPHPHQLPSCEQTKSYAISNLQIHAYCKQEWGEGRGNALVG